MEGLTERQILAEKVITCLFEVLKKDVLTEIERDALIQRFEFSFEIMWKCGKDYLRFQEGIDAASPKKVIRCLREVGIFDDDETTTLLMMADDRNLTSHTYDEEFAQEMEKKIRVYAQLLAQWHKRLIVQ